MTVPLTKHRHEQYAWERALGKSAREAARIAGYNPQTGVTTRLEKSGHPVQARISELRALNDEMMREKFRRIEARLTTSAEGNIFDYATIDKATGDPIIDWKRVMESDFAVAVNEFVFDKDTGRLVRFKRDDALAAIAQLRDMYGFKAPAKTEHTGAEGGPMVIAWQDDE